MWSVGERIAKKSGGSFVFSEMLGVMVNSDEPLTLRIDIVVKLHDDASSYAKVEVFDRERLQWNEVARIHQPAMKSTQAVRPAAFDELSDPETAIGADRRLLLVNAAAILGFDFDGDSEQPSLPRPRA